MGWLGHLSPSPPVGTPTDTTRGVATGWTGVDMSTPLLPETIPEIDADPASFWEGGSGGSQ